MRVVSPASVHLDCLGCGRSSGFGRRESRSSLGLIGLLLLLLCHEVVQDRGRGQTVSHQPALPAENYGPPHTVRITKL
jgi:hypothetical protein